MVKKIITKEVDVCDICGGDDYIKSCIGCGIEHCWKCRKKYGILYASGVFSSGTGDGYFCQECNTFPPEKIEDLHRAYLNIRNLRDEHDAWVSKFEERKKKVEVALKALQETY